MVAIAMEYEANDCFIRNGLGIDSSNASELEGKTVAVPLNTMADFAFRSYMSSLNVDTSTMTIVDQAPADGAKSLADGNVDMACIFGGNSSKAAGEVTQLIKDGRKNKVLNKKISANIRVTMIHGQRDEVVPTIYSNYVLNIFRKAKKKKVIIKNGDHSLSNQRSLKRIIKELEIIIKDIF